MLSVAARQIPNRVGENVHALGKFSFFVDRIGHCRHNGLGVWAGYGCVDGHGHDWHGVAAARVARHIGHVHPRHHHFLRRGENALRAHNHHRVVFALILAGNGVQTVGGNCNDLLVGVFAGMDGLNAEAVFVAQEQCEVKVLFGGVEFNHAVAVGVFHINHSEFEAGAHFGHHQTGAVKRAGENRP